MGPNGSLGGFFCQRSHAIVAAPIPHDNEVLAVLGFFERKAASLYALDHFAGALAHGDKEQMLSLTGVVRAAIVIVGFRLRSQDRVECVSVLQLHPQPAAQAWLPGSINLWKLAEL